MAISKLTLFAISISLLFLKIAAYASPIDAGYPRSDGSDSQPRAEFDQLKSKISDLESSIEYKSRELKSKDESIARMEKIIQEKTDTIVALKSDIELIQKKGTVDAEEVAGKAYARVSELEKQVEKLKDEVDDQNKRKDALDTQASEADKKIQQLNAKIEKLQKINDEQKTRIRKFERALGVAEEEMMKAKLEATSKINELTEVHGAWFPPWLATHLVRFQSFTVKRWIEHGRPVFDIAMQKVFEKSAQAQKWAEPHLEVVKTRWVPALKEQWITFTTSAEPYVQLVTTRTVEFFESSKSTVMPHVKQSASTHAVYLGESEPSTS